MQILVGLGNPGNEYLRTRHNAGFIVLDLIAHAFEMPNFAYKKDLFADISKNSHYLMVKPQTYMNDSGKAVRAVLDFYKDAVDAPLVDNLLVVHDDLDIPFGEYKLQQAKRPKVHNGLTSIHAYISEENFWYLRIGIDSRQGDRTIPGKAYVLQSFSLEEKEKLERVTIQEIVPDIMARFTK
ncbi:MAG: aminoacyl-tRNA hydrolase [Candidatus Pacebacteria bacterium]|nr:aminoacyl-tRNA hydrolase [Candidatus Paceibacterota bacterium]PIR64153.1 MAG: aminoacyl-tRNA hydrolase [Candidatus Pacebacteria bacterium CG10_big_fil_rev_8_21_14_0_10_40_26]PIZ79323.1 MAG: aminoacyl-tRNA hydrolase [Candidatus Pacebacteria bacterium CG_4_10_14_0_2_um_filter_40_20]PJA68979.1 MAG: aminoacyl-tRNA hydrolase [Candidatus Pacebacteria bacterium CG_4_9_14_3_um_filter_40_12]PJC42290.1 MAG: aminoacyl-tRNA hydrolase [Candidatus Pacebacteria bacterium CG_4_9_14_0_2_um_filter_40_15]